MKLVSVKCPDCGAVMEVNREENTVICSHCGAHYLLDDEATHIEYENAEDAGYLFEKGRQRAQAEAAARAARPMRRTTPAPVHAPKKRKTWLWVLGWIFLFPLPLTVIVLRKKDMNKLLQTILLTAAWLFYFYLAFFGNSRDPSREGATSLSSSPKETRQDLTSAPPEAIRDENLRGRGLPESGRQEPYYVNHIGYVVIDSAQRETLKSETGKATAPIWKVPTYQKDAQIWKPGGSWDHKTEVLVKEQFLDFHSWGSRFRGHLRVQRLSDGKEVYINVDNFVTKPYWTYKNNPLLAASTGYYLAEFHQKSGSYPMTQRKEKRELKEGTRILVTGLTGVYGEEGPNEKENQIEGLVWEEGPSSAEAEYLYFHGNDLNLIY